MSYGINGFAQVPVRLRVTAAGVPITNTTAVDVSAKDLLVAVLQSIPNQAGATTTVAQLVTALQTLP